MAPGQSSTLQMPSFLRGTFTSVARKARQEGTRCGEQYRKDGTFSAPVELLDVSPGDAVIAHEVVDFQREQPAWRLYLVSMVMGALGDALDWQDTTRVRARFEAMCLETAWGALYFAVEQPGALNAHRVARRLHALMNFWEPLQSARYLFKTFNVTLTLEDLMVAACDWAMDAWSPGNATSVRARLQTATESMARATREDCIEAIVRQMPRALVHARGLKHPDTLSNPALLRQHLTTLAPAPFERMSAARTSDLLGHLYAWDRQLSVH